MVDAGAPAVQEATNAVQLQVKVMVSTLSPPRYPVIGMLFKQTIVFPAWTSASGAPAVLASVAVHEPAEGTEPPVATIATTLVGLTPAGTVGIALAPPCGNVVTNPTTENDARANPATIARAAATVVA